MGRIEADIALESWLFGFRPCSGQGQFTILSSPPACSAGLGPGFSSRACAVPPHGLLPAGSTHPIGGGQSRSPRP